MTEENRFCVRCGARLPEGAEFCPECGASVDGGGNPYVSQQPYQPRQSTAVPKMSIYILIYGVLAVIFGLMSLYEGAILSEADWNTMMDMYEQMGFEGILPPWDEFFRTQMLISGACMILSGACALAGYWFCRQRGPRMHVVILCAVASVLTLGMMDVTAVITLIIGLFVTYMVYNDKTGFAS